MKNILIVLLSMSMLISCSHQIEDYKNTKPKFVLEEFFNNKLIARGIVQDYSNKMTRHFCVEIDANWQADGDNLVGTIDEEFYFDDGERQNRIWSITRIEDNGKVSYQGTANDVPELAYGSSEGNAFRWQYELSVAIKDDDGGSTTYVFDVDDWMYQLDENYMFNRSSLIKFGIEVGQISIYFDKQTPFQQCQAA
ncbi:DUF3833 domain-containing protein [Thalassomonas sp. M1454]|uniref:DUF3833 domain-containing protein n=1 Tax=Thalassomonas sp. M1454 TaxID=2594477 RepID=UPI00117E385F|nr:DUF3833 domain-containing protein [Thalassomonas sp. M1454]TRX55051.1 DUF3833 domain-containing protein [Thalassomonas sp. M1454]